MLPSSESSLLSSEVDFSQTGKQLGYIRLPHSVHRSAYGWLPIPVASIKNGTGPKLVLTAGVHGDEYEGQVILNRLMCELQAEQIQGQLIIIPMLNFPAAEAGLRISPIDDLNLNRVFPGDARGTPTQMIAHYLETVILKGADYYLDIHTGGSSLEYLPTALYDENGSAEIRAKQRQMLDCLALPHALNFGREAIDWLSTSAALRNGASALTVELGGNAQLNHRYTKKFYDSLLRLLKAVCGYQGVVEPPSQPTCYLTTQGYQQIFAHQNGLFEPLFSPGDYVKQGDAIALLHDPATPGSEPISVTTEASGLILSYRVLAQTRRGDCLFELVQPN